jgi:phosphoserine aminotransferase
LQIIDNQFLKLLDSEKWKFINHMTTILEKHEAAFDIKGHRDGPPGLRIWCGPTIEPEDLEYLLPWLDWTFQYLKTKNF